MVPRLKAGRLQRRNSQRPAPKASVPRLIVPPRWDAGRLPPWNGWRQASVCSTRLRHGLLRRLMFPKAASCWLCRRCWQAACCVMRTNTFNSPRGFMVSRPSFCCWLSWRWPGSNRLRRYAIMLPENGAICWASTELRKCAPCASSSSIWRTRSKPFRGARSFAKSG